MEPGVVALIVWLLLPLFLIAILIVRRKKLRAARQYSAAVATELDALKERFAPVVSIEDEVSNLLVEVSGLKASLIKIQSEYVEKRKLLSELERQVAVYNDALSFAELGLYERHFDFGDSEAYKNTISEVRESQKAMVAAKAATHCPNDWTVDGSRAKGQTMINRQTRLTMRAFNNECDAAIANARWNNVVAMEKRILNAAKAINSANSSMRLEISEEYVALKLDELHLTHEYREQQKIERDERAELARAEREEKKLLAQAEAAEREERKYQALLNKVRGEAALDPSNAAMQARIAELEAALAAAHDEGERARSMAQMTKCGYVYIISNIGSFGEDIVKIGLTRRLEPDDRVRELGDASVPFSFDTHAMIYSDEAPALEAALHKQFADRRVNTANFRKEFFQVSLDEVEEAVATIAPEASFFKDREAQEWHETLARRNAVLSRLQRSKAVELPQSI